MNMFMIGEQIGFLHEQGQAVVLEILSDNRARIKDTDGFEQIRNFSDLIKIYGTNYKLDTVAIPIEKQFSKGKKKINLTNNSAQQQNTFWEIDLHVDRILNSYTSLSNTEILLKQIHQFKDFYQRAKNKRVPKIVVIHGVGEGVLKNEIRSYLSKQDNIEFFDASYLDYGKGATEIRIRYSN